MRWGQKSQMTVSHHSRCSNRENSMPPPSSSCQIQPSWSLQSPLNGLGLVQVQGRHIPKARKDAKYAAEDTWDSSSCVSHTWLWPKDTLEGITTLSNLTRCQSFGAQGTQTDSAALVPVLGARARKLGFHHFPAWPTAQKSSLPILFPYYKVKLRSRKGNIFSLFLTYTKKEIKNPGRECMWVPFGSPSSYLSVWLRNFFFSIQDPIWWCAEWAQQAW